MSPIHISRRIVLTFPRSLLDKPIVYRLIKDFDLVFNILKARINPAEEGLLVLELTGEEDQVQKGIKYLTDLKVKVQPLSQDIRRIEEKCTHCGACVSVCPTSALAIDPVTRQVNFDNSQCIACELCLPACPPRAMVVHFDEA